MQIILNHEYFTGNLYNIKVSVPKRIIFCVHTYEGG